MEKYLKTQNVLREFVKFAEEKGVEPKEAEIQKSSPLMTRLLHAYIIRDVLGDDGFFPFFERDDEITKKAVELLNNN